MKWLIDLFSCGPKYTSEDIASLVVKAERAQDAGDPVLLLTKAEHEAMLDGVLVPNRYSHPDIWKSLQHQGLDY